MALIKSTTETVFDLTAIAKSNLIWAKHTSWDEGRTGIVISASEDRLVVEYMPGTGNVINHYVIDASEVLAGQWTIRWSEALVTINQYPEA